MIVNKPLWGQDRWKDIWVHLQEPESILTVFHVPAYNALTPPGNQEADTLARVEALATDPSVDTEDWGHRKSGHHSARVGSYIAKDAGLSLTYSDLVNAATASPGCSKRCPKQL